LLIFVGDPIIMRRRVLDSINQFNPTTLLIEIQVLATTFPDRDPGLGYNIS
jgi:hypothetical protein